MIRVLLPAHLRQLARCEHEVRVEAVATQRAVLDAVELQYPMLRGTIRGHESGPRRAFSGRPGRGRGRSDGVKGLGHGTRCRERRGWVCSEYGAADFAWRSLGIQAARCRKSAIAAAGARSLAPLMK